MKNPYAPQQTLPDGWQAWSDHDLASHVLSNSPDILQRSLAVRLFNHAHENSQLVTAHDTLIDERDDALKERDKLAEEKAALQHQCDEFEQGCIDAQNDLHEMKGKLESLEDEFRVYVELHPDD